MSTMQIDLNLLELRNVNITRAVRWHQGGLEEWSVNDWLAAMGGEAGEALNAGKKHRRLIGNLQQHGNVPLSLAEAEERIMEELADTVIYADLTAARLGRSLACAIIRKFKAISEREGFPERLGTDGRMTTSSQDAVINAAKALSILAEVNEPGLASWNIAMENRYQELVAAVNAEQARRAERDGAVKP